MGHNGFGGLVKVHRAGSIKTSGECEYGNQVFQLGGDFHKVALKKAAFKNYNSESQPFVVGDGNGKENSDSLARMSPKQNVF